MLQREIDTYRSLYETTLKAGKEASVASALRPVTARLVDRAFTPRLPIRPNLTVNLTIGLLGGVVFGMALVLLRERTDASIRAPGAFSVYPQVRELGVIPCASVDPQFAAVGSRPRLALTAGRFPASSRPAARGGVLEPVELASWNRKGSLLAESFRATLTSVLMSGQSGSDRQILLVTSPSPREGKDACAHKPRDRARGDQTARPPHRCGSDAPYPRYLRPSQHLGAQRSAAGTDTLCRVSAGDPWTQDAHPFALFDAERARQCRCVAAAVFEPDG